MKCVNRFAIGPGVFLTLLLIGGQHSAWAQGQPMAQPPAPQAANASSGTNENDNSADTINPERPGYTNGVDTVTPGYLQLETGYAYTRNAGVRSHRLNDTAQLRVPLSLRWEFRVGLPVYLIGRGDGAAQGFGDGAVSVKVQLSPSHVRHPGLALIVGTTVPLGSAELSQNHTQPSADLEGSLRLSPNTEVQANLIYADARSGGEQFNQWSGAVSVNHDFTPVVNGFVEVYRITPSSPGASNVNFFDGGVTYQLNPNTQLDFSAGRRLAQHDGDYFVSAGISLRFGVGRKRR